MARFDPEVRPTRDPSYLGLSQPLEKPKADTTYEKLFSGIGDVLSGAVTTADEHFKKQAREASEQAIEKERDAQGVGLAVQDPNLFNSNVEKVDPNLPPGVLKAGRNIDKWREANLDGKLNDVYYSARLDSEVRRIKAQFPGHKDEIDKYFSSKLGFTPANKLRESLQREYETARSNVDKERDSLQRFVEQNAKYDPAGAKAVLDGKMSRTEFSSRVWDKQAEEKQIESARAKIALNKDVSAQQTDQVIGVLHQNLNMEVRRVLDQTVMGMAGGYKNFNDMLSKFKDKPPSPEEAAQLRSLFGNLKAQVTNKVLDIVNSPLAQGSTETFASKIGDKSKIDGVIAIQLSPLDVIEQRLVNGEFGLLKHDLNMIAATENAAVNRLYSSDEVFSISAAVRKIGGPEFYALLPRLDNNLLSDTSKALTKIMNQRTMVKGESVTQQLRDMKRVGQANGNTVRQHLINQTETLKEAAKTDNREVLTNFVNGLYSENPLPEIVMKDRLTVFGMFASPEITQSLQKHPDLFQKYSAWVQRRLPEVLAVQGQKVQEGFEDSSINITYENGQFRLNRLRLDPRRYYTSPSVMTGKSPLHSSVEEAVNDINRGLQLAKPVLEASGVNFEQYANQVIQGIVRGGIGPKKPEKGLWEKLLDALSGSDTQNVPEPMFKEQGGNSGKLSLAPSTPMSDFIGKAEGADYDTLYGGWKGPRVKVTELTVAEALEVQRENREAGAESSPIGKGQFMPDTIRSLVREGVISLKDQLTPDVQEKMIEALIERRRKQATGPDGKLDREKFADALAQEWASFPTREGKSHYEGIAGNKATVSRKKLLAMLEGR